MPLQIVSVNVAQARPLRIHGRSVLSGIRKQAAAGPVAVGALGLAGDEQADLSVHGGLDKAVYAFAVEHLLAWQHMRCEALAGRPHPSADEPRPGDDAPPHPDNAPLPPGFVGENLSLSGLLEHEVWVGDRLVLPHCTLRVTAPRQPCDKFNAVMGYAKAARQMVQTARCGFYLAVEQPGSVQAGEPFELQPGPRALRIDHAIRAKAAKFARD